MKVASLTTGILSLVFCFVPIVGIVLGIAAVCTAARSGEKVSGMSAAGLVCGIVGLCLGAAMTLAMGCTACLANRAMG